jgi:hypothetical protein
VRDALATISGDGPRLIEELQAQRSKLMEAVGQIDGQIQVIMAVNSAIAPKSVVLPEAVEKEYANL